MSCIAGIINLDGAPVDRDILERMTAAMRSRAPDGTGIWAVENVGFGHALLNLSAESEHEQQPFTLGGETWITADARIDGRAELIAKLRSAGRQVKTGAPDAELILHTYHVFGESFLQHLIGDFAFALWDAPNRKLVCARDHFGMRPFFYARSDQFLLFASDINALLAHPGLTHRLDELFIADLLLIGCPIEAETSIYTDIRRLPPAGVLTVNGVMRCSVNRYWELPVHPVVRFKNNNEYVEKFLEIFCAAVSDRMFGNRVAVEMSGGMDSTSIAAVATEINKEVTPPLLALTVAGDRLIPEDRESYYADMVASHLDIPIFYQHTQDQSLFEQYDSPKLRTAEPFSNPYFFEHYQKLKLMLHNGTRILLTGQGGDAGFAGQSSFVKQLLYRGKLLKLLSEVRHHYRFTGTLKGMGLRSAIFPQARKIPDWKPAFPDWLSAEFTHRNELQERWNGFWSHGLRQSGAYDQLRSAWLSQALSSYEALNLPVVVRHPFYDLRLISFLLGIPNYMVGNKQVMREAMREMLPDPIRLRPKTAAVGDIVRLKFASIDHQCLVRENLDQVSAQYIDKKRFLAGFDRYLKGEGSDSTWSSGFMITAVALNNWMKYSYTKGGN